MPDSMPIRVAALGLVVPDGAVVCDRHAAWLHGATMILAPGEQFAALPIHVARLPGVSRSTRSSLDSRQRDLLATDVVEIGGLLVTSPLRTALDLGRVRRPVESLSGLDAMLRTGVDPEAIAAEIERFKGERWVSTLRATAPVADRGSASPGESAVKWEWFCLTGEKPDLQIQLTGPRGPVFLDLGSRERRYAVEYDGREWHDSPAQVAHDTERRAFIRAAHEFVVDVVRAENVYGAQADIQSILRAGLARSQRRTA